MAKTAAAPPAAIPRMVVIMSVYLRKTGRGWKRQKGLLNGGGGKSSVLFHAEIVHTID
jgi:hypothetical protein